MHLAAIIQRRCAAPFKAVDFEFNFRMYSLNAKEKV